MTVARALRGIYEELMALAPVVHRVDLDLPVAAAFRLFTQELGEWWPIAYTFSGAEFEDAVVEPRAGGSWLERDRRGQTLPWGEVRAYEPERRLVLSFAISPERKPAPADRASEVEVRFVEVNDQRTQVEIEHRKFEQHGAGADATRQGMDSAHGWPLILAELRRAARREARASAG